MNQTQPTRMHNGRSVPLVALQIQFLNKPGPKRPFAAAVACVLALAAAGSLPLHGSTDYAESSMQPAAKPLAAAALEEVRKQDQSAATRLNLSLAFINNNAPGRAKSVLQDLLARDAGNIAGWNNLCVAQVMLQQLQDAINDCNHALSLDATYQLARNNLKWATEARQQELDALNKLQQTSPADRDAAFFIGEGMHFLHLGDYDKAVTAWQRVLLLDSHNAIAANNIGVAFMLNKQPGTAMTWFRKATAWDPAMQIAKDNIVWAQEEEDPSHTSR